MATKTAPRHPGTRPRRAAAATRADARANVRAATARRQRRRGYLLGGLALVVVVTIIGAMMYTARTTSRTATRTAPDFTLTDTGGRAVHLADYRGRNVVLYFSEGTGCQSCLYQIADIEKHAGDFTAANVTILPIVMNTADDIRQDMAANNVKTPFLIDTDGSVSRAYGTLGKGMHPGLPGHSFVLIDKTGTQRRNGEYPSMYLSSADLLTQVRKHLG